MHVTYADQLTKPALIALSLLLCVPVSAKADGKPVPVTAQPASDVLMSYDLWGNPTPRGGVTNGGATSHSVW